MDTKAAGPTVRGIKGAKEMIYVLGMLLKWGRFDIAAAFLQKLSPGRCTSVHETDARTKRTVPFIANARIYQVFKALANLLYLGKLKMASQLLDNLIANNKLPHVVPETIKINDLRDVIGIMNHWWLYRSDEILYGPILNDPRIKNEHLVAMFKMIIAKKRCHRALRQYVEKITDEKFRTKVEWSYLAQEMQDNLDLTGSPF